MIILIFYVVAPKITGLKDLVVRVGTTVKFDAKVIGEPPPKKVWFFGKDQQKTGGRVTLEMEDYKTKLVINSVERRDCGEYKLCVENNSGKDEALVTLNVLGELLFTFFFNIVRKFYFLSIFYVKFLKGVVHHKNFKFIKFSMRLFENLLDILFEVLYYTIFDILFYLLLNTLFEEYFKKHRYFKFCPLRNKMYLVFIILK